MTKDVTKLRAEWGPLTQDATSFQQDLLARLEEACRERDEARAQLRKLIEFVTSHPHLLSASVGPTGVTAGAQQAADPYTPTKLPESPHHSPAHSAHASLPPSARAPGREQVDPVDTEAHWEPSADSARRPAALPQLRQPQHREIAPNTEGVHAGARHGVAAAVLAQEVASSASCETSLSQSLGSDSQAISAAADVASDRMGGALSTNGWPLGAPPNPPPLAGDGARRPFTLTAGGGGGASDHLAQLSRPASVGGARAAPALPIAAGRRRVPRLLLRHSSSGESRQAGDPPRAPRAVGGGAAPEICTPRERHGAAPQGELDQLSAGNEAHYVAAGMSASEPLLRVPAGGAGPVADAAACARPPAAPPGEGPWGQPAARAAPATQAAPWPAAVASPERGAPPPAAAPAAAPLFACGRGVVRLPCDHPLEPGHPVAVLTPRDERRGSAAAAPDPARRGPPSDAVTTGDVEPAPPQVRSAQRLPSARSAPQLNSDTSVAAGGADPAATPPASAASARVRVAVTPAATDTAAKAPHDARRAAQPGAERCVSVPGHVSELVTPQSSGSGSAGDAADADADAPPHPADAAVNDNSITLDTDSFAIDSAPAAAAAGGNAYGLAAAAGGRSDTWSFGAEVRAQLTVRDLSQRACGAPPRNAPPARSAEAAISLRPATAEPFGAAPETAVLAADYVPPGQAPRSRAAGAAGATPAQADAPLATALRTAQAAVLRADAARDGAHRYSAAARALYGMSLTPGELLNTGTSHESESPSPDAAAAARERAAGAWLAAEALRQTASEAARPLASVASSVTTVAPPTARGGRASRRRRRKPRAHSAPAPHTDSPPATPRAEAGAFSPFADEWSPLLAMDASQPTLDACYAEAATGASAAAPTYVPPRHLTRALAATEPGASTRQSAVLEGQMLGALRRSDVGPSTPVATAAPSSRHHSQSREASPDAGATTPLGRGRAWRRVRGWNTRVVRGVRSEQDALLATLEAPMQPDRGRPTAALVIFRCLLRWDAVSAPRADVLDRVATSVSRRVEPAPRRGAAATADAATLSYWAANLFTLLLLLHCNVAFAPTDAGTARHGAQLTRLKTSVQQSTALMRTLSLRPFARRSGSNTPSGRPTSGPPADCAAKVTAGAAVSRFRIQLESCLARALPLLRDGFIRSIAETLSDCVAPAARVAPAAPLTAKVPSAPWRALVLALDTLHRDLQAACLPRALQRPLYEQLLAHINAALFNRVVSQRERVTLAVGEHCQRGLLHLEQWLAAAGADAVGGADGALQPFREAVAFLCLPNKPARSLGALQADTCPRLGAPQLYRLAAWFHDDETGTRTVSKPLLAQLRGLLEEQPAGFAPASYLLADPAKCAFMPDIAQLEASPELYEGLAIPAPLRRYADKRQREAFAFLEEPLNAGGVRGAA